MFLLGHSVVTAEKNCFQESFKAIETVRMSKFISQRVADCQVLCFASVIIVLSYDGIYTCHR